jgi:hypothetical protein
MWNNITDIAKNAAAFLQSGKSPPNTPVQYREDLSRINFFSSKKFFIVFSAIGLLVAFYFASVGILFLTAYTPSLTGSFVIIFVEIIKIFAIIISVYLGLQATIDFKYGTQSTYENINNTSSEYREEKIINEQTIKYAEKYKDEPSYAPIEWSLEKNLGQ